MKTILKSKNILLLAGILFSWVSCQDALNPEPIDPLKKVGSIYEETVGTSEDYYAKLRAYKESDHAVSFCWFSEWTGTGASLQNTMQGLPDSIDIVSMWGGWKNPGEARLKDLRYCQEVKGIKALTVFVMLDIGDQITPEGEDKKKFWGWIDDDETAKRIACEKYANAICDTIEKYNYDGFDLDWEPSYAQPFNTEKNLVGTGITYIVNALSKRLGPKSGTGKLLVIDGEPELMPDTLACAFDYYISQAYACRSYSNLDSRLQKIFNAFADAKNVDGTPMTREQIARKFIVTENFESYALQGGVTHTTRDGRTVQSLEGMALWNPVINGKTVRKGGCGAFRPGFEYKIEGTAINMTYPAMRKSIQIMNPAVY
ncbi:glycoside hydrolase family 18 [Proteiniphilum sp. X52]|uniref:glycoside hydrolase family 18 n=1 Tax=Proteiniphilum sp. X52 TaxID=2382159 RepID=UPI000F0A4DEA|nr:glycoside hydrolase family 18 [Proteiniphilum sp. X52]RNC64315.1 endoglycosidase [Proteiniphilum sp. X52]